MAQAFQAEAFFRTGRIMESAAFLETFVDYPPSHGAASFSIEQIEKNVETRSQAKMAKP